MKLYDVTHARKCAGGVQKPQQNNGRRMLSTREGILFRFKKKRGERYLALEITHQNAI